MKGDLLMEERIPVLAKGTVIPPYVQEKMRLEEERQQQMEELKQIADSTQEQLKIMSAQLDFQIKESQDAKREARNSKILSIVAIIVSAVFAIIPLLIG